jgi:hypothetical protein
MTSDAPQGSERWQASDGNLNPPQEQTGYAPPPPPGHTTPAGQTLTTATAASTAIAAKFPVAAWLLFAGCAVGLISGFLPTRNSTNGESQSISLGDELGNFVLTVVVVGLVWATFTRPRPRLWSLIPLTVLTAVEVFGETDGYLGLASRSASPEVGNFVTTGAIGFWAVGTIMAWITRAKARPSPPPAPGHAAPAGQTLGNATAPSTVGAAKFPVAAWLLFAGSAIFLSSDFLAKSILMGHVFADLLITTVVVALVWATFTQPRPRLWSLITLTVYIAVEVFGGIVIYLNLASRSAAPSVGLLVSTAAVALLVVGVIMAWIARSKTHPSAFS